MFQYNWIHPIHVGTQYGAAGKNMDLFSPK